MPLYFSVLSAIALAIGGMVEIIPTLTVKDNVPTIASVKPYSPLELEGRDLYIREGCNACHTQMIRPFRDEVVRFNGKNGQTSNKLIEEIKNAQKELEQKQAESKANDSTKQDEKVEKTDDE
jgi:hypothetical protein